LFVLKLLLKVEKHVRMREHMAFGGGGWPSAKNVAAGGAIERHWRLP